MAKKILKTSALAKCCRFSMYLTAELDVLMHGRILCNALGYGDKIYLMYLKILDVLTYLHFYFILYLRVLTKSTIYRSLIKYNI